MNNTMAHRTMAAPSAVVALCLALVGCAQPEGVKRFDASTRGTVVISQQGVRITAKGEREVTRVIEIADKLDDASLLRRQGARRVNAAEVPILAQSPAGRAFLSQDGHRAVAVGSPARLCPAIGSSTPGAASRGTAVRGALTACLADLEDWRQSTATTLGSASGAADCDCALAAVDTMVLLPQTETLYALGTPARLKAPALGLDGLFVAEALPDGAIRIGDTRGAFATVRLTASNRARLVLDDAPEQAFEGDVVRTGFRRGRIARRFYLRDATGRQMALLVGFSPAELEAYAAAWLAFPPGLERRRSTVPTLAGDLPSGG